MIISEVRLPLRGLLGLMAAVGIGTTACAEDPLSSLDGTPSTIRTDFAVIYLSVGETQAVTASVLDGRATPLTTPVTFTACGADITVATDASYQPVPPTSARAIVTAVTAAPSCVQISGGGITVSVDVIVLPTSFAGTLSSGTPEGGSLLTITSTALLKFDPAEVSVEFGGGAQGLVTSATADQITVLVPFSSAGPLTISGIDVTYVPGLTVTLPTASAVTQTGDVWTGDLTFATAPEIALPAAAGANAYVLTNFAGANPAGTCAEIVFGFGSTGPCVVYKVVVPAGDTLNLTVTADWDSGADLDIYACDATGVNGCFEDGGAGATGAQPQAFTFDFVEGTHYIVVENYDGAETNNVYITITRN